MRLHSIVAGAIGAVNPFVPVALQVSVGNAQTGSSGQRAPLYATPGSVNGSVSGDVLTVSFANQGVVQPGQSLSGGGALAGTTVLAQLSGKTGGQGTYRLSAAQEIASAVFSLSNVVMGQIQPVTWRDLQLLEGLNLGGIRKKLYVDGRLDGVVKPSAKGGDLVTTLDGVQYLVAQALEQWTTEPGWTCAALTLQQGGPTWSPDELFPQILRMQAPFTPG